MAEMKKLHYPNAYKHRSYRLKYKEGYGAEGRAAGKTDIGEFKSGMADCQHGMEASPKEQTWKKADKVNKQQMKISHKTKPNPF
jgi:hypothetical protein